jgi:hypothetical protein
VLRMQERRRLNLRPQVRRSVDQNPVATVSRHGEASLSARLDLGVTVPGQLTGGAPTIPLRKATTRRGAENDGGQPTHSSGMDCTPGELEFGRQIAIDFEANADFNKRRCCPSHGCPSWFPALSKRAFGSQVNRSGIRKTRGFFCGSRLWIFGQNACLSKGGWGRMSLRCE